MQVSRHIKNSPLFSPKQFLYFWLCFLSETVTINLPSASQRDAMVAENDEMAIGIGWPLGLGFFNMRLRVVDSLPSAYSVAPYSLHIPSTSFSSFSSSNLDTELEFLVLQETVVGFVLSRQECVSCSANWSYTRRERKLVLVKLNEVGRREAEETGKGFLQWL
ncbi:uncharacterized protein LOC130956450 isoform X5 [Arachis stenosperma]|uniref:uncharacterized protein LOC130956450 isoform X5 n=1 Tax=Arachis stenosperma TaxID=217475 RepID=UPI0025AD1E5B|nr:uncharacterized protein LOC130956450 isoform X5 [Arachis stenosperma]